MRKFSLCGREEMEPAVGIEPTTDGLQNRCSTAELSWRPETERVGRQKEKGKRQNDGPRPCPESKVQSPTPKGGGRATESKIES